MKIKLAHVKEITDNGEFVTIELISGNCIHTPQDLAVAISMVIVHENGIDEEFLVIDVI